MNDQKNSETDMHNAKDLVLDYYHCTFFLPLIGLDKEGFEISPEVDRFYYDPKSNENLAEEEAQAYRYFSPTMRKLLFDFKGEDEKGNNNLEAIKEWRLPEKTIESWQLHLGQEKHKKNEEKKQKEDNTKYQRSKIVSVRLFQYFNGIYLLAVRVEPEALIEPLKKERKREKKEDDLWKEKDKLQETAEIEKQIEEIQKKQLQLFRSASPTTLESLCQNDPEHEDLYKELVMENWLHFTRNVRLLYPTFPQQNDENKIVPIHLMRDGLDTISSFKEPVEKIEIYDEPGKDFSPVMIEILKAFAKEPEKTEAILKSEAHFYDDRMFISSAYGIAGKQLPTESLKRLNTLVTYVDREYDTFDKMNYHVYTPEVIQAKTEENTFSLWEGLGGYYSYTGLSNSYLYNGWAFRNFIAPEHIPHIYDRMLVQALFYQASLRHYDDLICQETSTLIEKTDFKTMRKHRKEYIQFTNQYWFHNLTEQMQGKEIFALQQKALKLREHYEILKDQLERTEEYLQTEHEQKVNEISSRFTHYGFMFAISALYYTMLTFTKDAIKEPDGSLWLCAGQWLNQYLSCLSLPDRWIGFIALIGLPPLIILIYYLYDKYRKKT